MNPAGDIVPPPVGRRLRATYAFAGAAVELGRTVPLRAGEEILLHGVMRLRRLGRLPRPVALRLTPQRLSLLLHFAFQPDRVLDLPRGSVRQVGLARNAVQLSWTSDDAGGITVMRLTGWTGRPAVDSSLYDAGAVSDILRAWLDSPDGRLPTHRPASHRPR
jgi:hypothetical protein